MGQMFYDMGLLSTNDYSECSASDLVGQFVGQTGPKTTNVLRKGLGKVLFVDEAYRLAEGHFAKEAIDELVDRLTKPEFLGKMVVILAGYTENMNELLSVNPGLSSRFPEEIMFQNMTPEECLTLLQQQLSKEEVEFNLDSQSRSHSDIANLLKRLSALPSWANGRDVKTLTKAITAAAYEKAEPTSSTELRVSSDDVLTALQKMYDEQSARCKTGQKWTRANSINNSALPPSFDFAINSPTITPPTTTNAYSKVSTTAHAEPFPPLQQDAQTRNQNTTATSMSGTAATERDDGVSDETWTQLQADILANAEAERRSQQLIADLKEEVKTAIRDADEAIAQEAKAVIKSDNPTTDSGSDDDEETEKRRQQEQARLRAVAARRAKLEAENRLHRAREEQERKRAQEVRNQKKLREMGVCPVGFRWIKQSSGYRCAGGSHFIDNASLGI